MACSRFLFVAALVLYACLAAPVAGRALASRPNVVLIMTDDQGYGDFGVTGNDVIQTPHLDGLAKQSVTFDAFYVSPVCTPTRASLMTGRYNYRTCAIDTYLGRAMMHPDEVTVAERLAEAGYRTAIFGKWHLGDNYPLRAIDQGFHEALVHKGGGIGQPSDPPGGDHYFDPTLYHNGRPIKTQGYCSDIYTDAAIRWITANRERPFFVYLPFNCPHTPLEIADHYVEPYLEAGVDRRTAQIYGMITNVDENVGRLLGELDDLELAGNTIVIFLTDNGPNGQRYNGGLRGSKGSVYEGGIRTACFVRWPGQLDAGHRVQQPAAHIDLAPTLLSACGAGPAAGPAMDGRDLLPLIRNEPIDWPERTLFFQWHRGDVPQLYRHFAARAGRFKLVQPSRAGRQNENPRDRMMLFDLANDPGEQDDVAARYPAVTARLKAEYEAWFRDVGSTRGYDPPRIHLGTAKENPVILTRQDWRGPRAGWEAKDLGYWEVTVAETGRYDVTLRFAAKDQIRRAHVRISGVTADARIGAGAEQVVIGDVAWAAGDGRLEAWIAQGDETVGVHYVEAARRD